MDCHLVTPSSTSPFTTLTSVASSPKQVTPTKHNKKKDIIKKSNFSANSPTMNIRADELIELIVMYLAQSLLFRIGYQALMALSFAPPYDTYDLRKLLRDQLPHRATGCTFGANYTTFYHAPYSDNVKAIHHIDAIKQLISQTTGIPERDVDASFAEIMRWLVTREKEMFNDARIFGVQIPNGKHAGQVPLGLNKYDEACIINRLGLPDDVQFIREPPFQITDCQTRLTICLPNGHKSSYFGSFDKSTKYLTCKLSLYPRIFPMILPYHDYSDEHYADPNRISMSVSDKHGNVHMPISFNN
jgi:hypothetical protein